MNPAVPHPACPTAALPVFEPVAAVARLGGRTDFLRQVLDRFESVGPAQVGAAEAALAAGDAELLRRSLHSLAGTCATCGGDAAAAQAGRLSVAAAAGQHDEVRDGLPLLRGQVQAFMDAARDWAAVGTR